MNLVVLYGPPAVGKLTTAERIAEITGYKAFHSHLAIDLVNSITPDDAGRKYSTLLFKIIYDTIEFAHANNQKGIIITIAYTGSEGQKTLLQKLKALVESDGGKICFVRLYCTVEELKKRVVDPSRDYYGKLMDPEELERWLSQINYFNKVDFAESMEIDNTNATVEEVAETIRIHFRL